MFMDHWHKFCDDELRQTILNTYGIVVENHKKLKALLMKKEAGETIPEGEMREALADTSFPMIPSGSLSDLQSVINDSTTYTNK
mgnify:CR=1 FL=1